MKKKLLAVLVTGLLMFGMVGMAQAALTTIGTASYGGVEYNLIYDNDDTGYNGGGLVWLDYTHSVDIWQNQRNWALGVGSSLTVTLNPGYTTSIDWATGWRLPDTVDGVWQWQDGYEGDPNNDGDYSYTAGYNLANSEMGHLFYTELGNTGYLNTDGAYNTVPAAPDYFLQNTGDFDNLIASWYWSGTEYASNPFIAWGFNMRNGYQGSVFVKESSYLYGLAVLSGQVSPVPEPATIFLLGSGLIGLAGLRKKLKK